MASFSDPPEPARRGFVPPQNEAERFLMTRVEELCRTAESRGFPRATGFLSDREQSLAWAAVCRAGCGCTRWEGGYPGAERRVLCIEPAGSWALEPVAALRIAAQGTPPPAHRDYLGALLGLGIQRTCLGDILPDPDAAGVVYAFVLEDKADFLAAELTQAGRCPVRAERCDAVPDRVLAAPERTLRQATVPSLRADAVLGAMTVPDIFYATGNLWTALVGLIVAVALAWKEKSLLTVAVFACAAVAVAQLALLLVG